MKAQKPRASTQIFKSNICNSKLKLRLPVDLTTVNLTRRDQTDPAQSNSVALTPGLVQLCAFSLQRWRSCSLFPAFCLPLLRSMAHATAGLVADKLTRLQELDFTMTDPQSSGMSCDTIPAGTVMQKRHSFDRSSSVCSTAGTFNSSTVHAAPLGALPQAMRANSTGSKVSSANTILIVVCLRCPAVPLRRR